MGNTSSSHQPLERGFTRGTFGDFKNVVGIFHPHLDMLLFSFNFFESISAYIQPHLAVIFSSF